MKALSRESPNAAIASAAENVTHGAAAAAAAAVDAETVDTGRDVSGGAWSVSPSRGAGESNAEGKRETVGLGRSE